MKSFPLADLSRSGWTFSDPVRATSSWDRVLTHRDLPGQELTARRSGPSVVVHSQAANMPETTNRVYLCAFPILDDQWGMKDSVFWNSLNAAYGPAARLRISALFRMMSRWLIQANLDGAWTCRWDGTPCVSWTPHSLDEAAVAHFWNHPELVRFLDPIICTVLKHARGLLRLDRSGAWTTQNHVHAEQPASGHARLEQILMLRQHQRADADLLGLDLSDLDI